MITTKKYIQVHKYCHGNHDPPLLQRVPLIKDGWADLTRIGVPLVASLPIHGKQTIDDNLSAMVIDKTRTRDVHRIITKPMSVLAYSLKTIIIIISTVDTI